MRDVVSIKSGTQRLWLRVCAAMFIERSVRSKSSAERKMLTGPSVLGVDSHAVYAISRIYDRIAHR